MPIQYKVHFAHPVTDQRIAEILQDRRICGYVFGGKGISVCGSDITPLSEHFHSHYHYANLRKEPLPTTNSWASVTCGSCLRARKKFAYMDGFDHLIIEFIKAQLEQKLEDLSKQSNKIGLIQIASAKTRQEIQDLQNDLMKRYEGMSRNSVPKPPDISAYQIGTVRKLHE